MNESLTSCKDWFLSDALVLVAEMSALPLVTVLRDSICRSRNFLPYVIIQSQTSV